MVTASLSGTGALPGTSLTALSLPDSGALPTLTDLQDEATWLEWRSRVPLALKITQMVTTEDTRREFLEGARLLRMDVRKRPGDGGFGPSPIQLVIADVLNAGRPFNGILEPRRTTKTTAVQALILGRCSLREDYLTGWTMAKKAGGRSTAERFKKDIVAHLIRLYPNPKDAPFKWSVANGGEGIQWPSNGSWLNVYPPGSDAFTSGAFDIAWIDEAQDATPEMSEDFMTSIPPTFDGRVAPQMICSGTAPDFRAGNLLWNLVNADDADSAVLWHGAPEDTLPEEVEAWEPDEEHPYAKVRELIELHHPGIGFTTLLSDVERNHKKMGRDAFRTEYLSIAGDEGGSTSLFDPLKWASTGIDGGLPSPPDDFSIAFSSHPDQTTTSIVAVWRDEKGRAVPLFLSRWSTLDETAKELRRLWVKHRKPLQYDAAVQHNQIIVQKLERMNPKPKLEPQTFIEVKKAAALVVDAVKREQVVHFNDQTELNDAVALTIKRISGDRGWLLGFDRKHHPEHDITPVEAWALGLLAFDTSKPRSRSRGRVAA